RFPPEAFAGDGALRPRGHGDAAREHPPQDPPTRQNTNRSNHDALRKRVINVERLARPRGSKNRPVVARRLVPAAQAERRFDRTPLEHVRDEELRGGGRRDDAVSVMAARDPEIVDAGPGAEIGAAVPVGSRTETRPTPDDRSFRKRREDRSRRIEELALAHRGG